MFALALLGLFSGNGSSFKPRAVLVGGEYTVQAGETRQGDMLILFARVKVAESGQVAGNIRVFGGVLEIAGQVNGDVHAYGSEVHLDTLSARIDGAINTIYSLRDLPLVPSILLVIS
jgi:hypothetical protein